MTQATPTPVPDHGTGWGLLLLFLWLYGLVAVLGLAGAVAVGLSLSRRRVPAVLRYLLVAGLAAAVGLSAFVVAVAGSAGNYDVVALVGGCVALPLALVGYRRRGAVDGRIALLAHLAVVWSVPFLAGFGFVGFVATEATGLRPPVTGSIAVGIVVGGSLLVDHVLPSPAAGPADADPDGGQ